MRRASFADRWRLNPSLLAAGSLAAAAEEEEEEAEDVAADDVASRAEAEER